MKHTLALILISASLAGAQTQPCDPKHEGDTLQTNIELVCTHVAHVKTNSPAAPIESYAWMETHREPSPPAEAEAFKDRIAELEQWQAKARDVMGEARNLIVKQDTQLTEAAEALIVAVDLIVCQEAQIKQLKEQNQKMQDALYAVKHPKGKKFSEMIKQQKPGAAQ